MKPDDGTPDSLYNLVWTAHDAKVYTYTREVTNGACKVTDMIDVPILKVMEITVDPKEGKGCVEDEFQIQVTAVDKDTKEVLVGAEYEWKPEGADFSCVDCDNPIATLTGNGFSKLKITLDEYCPGEGGFAAILDAEPVPVDIKSGNPPCANGITNVYVESPDMDVTYTWSVTNGEIIGCTDCNQTEIRIGNGPTTVSITASSDSYCVDGMASLVIIPNEGMLKVVIDSVSAVCAGGIANVSVKEPIDGIEYIWTVTNGELTGCSSCIETQVRTSTSEITTVTVKATSTSCEEGTASVNVPIAASLDLLPKVFTPNSDNTNDFFTFYDKNVSEFIMPVDQIVSFQIFNRWGTKVYDNDTPEKGWDGKINGKDASQDVYLYQVELGDNFCNQKLVGDVTLLR